MRSAALAVCVAIASTLPANADSATGKISGYGPGTASGKSVIVFKLVGQQTSVCNTTARFLINTDSLHFQSTVATIIAAYHSGADITVYYTPTCTKFDNSFDASYVCVGSISC